MNGHARQRRCHAGRLWWYHRPPWTTSAAIVVLVMMLAADRGGASCPDVCGCKWKSGKQSVECRDKALITVPQGIDNATQVLDVTGNNLQILPGDAFRRVGLVNLQRVYLSRCRIGQIDGRALHGLTNAVEIDLSRNMLTAVPSATLADVPLLRDLSLAGNPIQRIGPDAFRHCTGLVRLDVSGCELHAVAATAFVGIERLETLKLDNNRLTELLAATVESLNKVHGVELHENPWHCDCKMRPVKVWLTKNNIPTAVDPSCASGPGRVTNRTFSTLMADDFACRPDIQQDDPTVDAATGENASVSCRVHSSPPAKVSWYWNGRPLANNTAFGPFQRVFMTDDASAGHSTLLLTNVQPSDSGQFLCVAENRAGRAEANFTLVVTRLGGLAFLANGQVAGLSVFLVFLIVTILLVIIYLLVRIKRLPPATTRSDGKPYHHPVTGAASAMIGNGTAIVVQVNCKQPSSVGGTATVVTTAATGAAAGPTGIVATAANATGYRGCGTVFDPVLMEPTNSPIADADGFATSTMNCKKPKLTELSFTTDHYDPGFGNSSVLDASRGVLYRSQPSNPDLIADATEQTPSVAAVVANLHNRHLQQQQQEQNHHHQLSARRSNSGEYRRTADDSLYSSGFWTQGDAAANDRTPIIEKSPPLPCSPPATAGKEQPATASDPKSASLRVWKHGVQVMPPLSALKRALNKGSPDEGYQEGCGTDV